MFKMYNKQKLVKGLTSNRDLLLNLAVNSTKTPKKYHEQDLKYAVRFIMDLPMLLERFKSDLSKKCIVVKPKGKILIVLSSNEPLIMSVIPVLTAFATGNKILLKSASRNIEFNNTLVKVYKESGITDLELIDFPKDGLENFLDKEEPSACIWFGSSRVIKMVAPIFASRMIEFIPECEGNDMVYVSEQYDDMTKVANVIMHSLIRHEGQCCNSIKGILVHKNAYKRLVDSINKVSESFIGGEILDGSVDFSFSLNKDVFKPLENIEGQPGIQEVTGDVTQYLNINPFTVKQWLHAVKSIEDALKIVEKNPFGIGFTIFSDSQKEIEKVVDTVHTARININKDSLEVKYTEPWGGTGLSGFGGSKSWFEKFTNNTFLSSHND